MNVIYKCDKIESKGEDRQIFIPFILWYGRYATDLNP
jgi:hypothetical protein